LPLFMFKINWVKATNETKDQKHIK
jgi:hypothetical protein